MWFGTNSWRYDGPMVRVDISNIKIVLHFCSTYVWNLWLGCWNATMGRQIAIGILKNRVSTWRWWFKKYLHIRLTIRFDRKWIICNGKSINFWTKVCRAADMMMRIVNSKHVCRIRSKTWLKRINDKEKINFENINEHFSTKYLNNKQIKQLSTF